MQRLNSTTGLLSPHHSIIQALQNPQLEMSHENVSQENQQWNDPQIANGFSSWQSISSGSPRLGHKRSSPGSILSSSDSDEEIIAFDSDDENGDTTSTVKESIPSFIMPRVSMSEPEGVVKVQVLGAQSEALVARLKTYKKKFLKNCEFTKKDPHLILLIVDNENYVLPKLLNKPFIPILLEDEYRGQDEEDFEDLSSRTFFKNSMICDPVKLKSIDQDLFGLINFLSNLDSKTFGSTLTHVSKFSLESNAISLSQLNSIVLDQQSSEILRKKALMRRRSSAARSSTSRYDDDSEDKKTPFTSVYGLRIKLVVGATIGAVSLTCIWMWKEFTTAMDPNCALELKELKELKDLKEPSMNMDISRLGLTLGSCLAQGMHHLESLREILLSSTFYFLDRTQIAVSHIMRLADSIVPGYFLDW
ncbi:unnamed protein product [Kuraishia capsulata CBS 1993]|uniref:Uncharacterized protein n=1 Tax=Kuraishia capsulata CBS 1993 TaxID=1382522 RepID=W6MPH6_9ASCO|nr:uncharacterized protein KUCA_T00004215001 [Kuraishia capsulata CBS 1993]CDK28233.1 unnamed protein product [Kuraishia capsulata CBS 1993]